MAAAIKAPLFNDSDVSGVVQALDKCKTTKRACEDEGRWPNRVKVDQKTICAHIFIVFWVEF